MKKINEFTNLTRRDVRRLNKKPLANTMGIAFNPSEADITMAEAHLTRLFNCKVYRPFAVKILYLNELYAD